MAKEQPLIEHKVTTSRNGRFLIHRTTIMHIYPSDYYRAVLANSIRVTEEELTDEEIAERVTLENGYLKLTDHAKKLGGNDNISIAIIRYMKYW